MVPSDLKRESLAIPWEIWAFPKAIKDLGKGLKLATQSVYAFNERKLFGVIV